MFPTKMVVEPNEKNQPALLKIGFSQMLNVKDYSWSARKRSASRAAIQPDPAAVTA